MSSTLSVTACPDSDVPAARKVTGVACRAASGRMRRTSSSLWIFTTSCGGCGVERVGTVGKLGTSAGAQKWTTGE